MTMKTTIIDRKLAELHLLREEIEELKRDFISLKNKSSKKANGKYKIPVSMLLEDFTYYDELPPLREWKDII